MTLVREVKREVKADLKSARRYHLPWWAILCLMIATALTGWLFDKFGKFDLVLPTLNSIMVLAFVVILKRRFWRDAWFWFTMTFVAALSVLLLLYVHWTDRWVPAMAIAGIDTIGFVAILVILALVERLVRDTKPDAA